MSDQETKRKLDKLIVGTSKIWETIEKSKIKPKMKHCHQCGEKYDYNALMASQPENSSVVLFGYCSDKCYNKASKG